MPIHTPCPRQKNKQTNKQTKETQQQIIVDVGIRDLILGLLGCRLRNWWSTHFYLNTDPSGSTYYSNFGLFFWVWDSFHFSIELPLQKRFGPRWQTKQHHGKLDDGYLILGGQDFGQSAGAHRRGKRVADAGDHERGDQRNRLDGRSVQTPLLSGRTTFDWGNKERKVPAASRNPGVSVHSLMTPLRLDGASPIRASGIVVAKRLLLLSSCAPMTSSSGHPFPLSKPAAVGSLINTSSRTVKISRAPPPPTPRRFPRKPLSYQ